MLKLFRVLSLMEGFSLVFLLFVAMPAKYQLGYGEVVFYAGMTHGIFWMIYFTVSLIVSHLQSWSVAFWALVLLASVIPFACLFLDRKLKEELTLVGAQQ